MLTMPSCIVIPEPPPSLMDTYSIEQAVLRFIGQVP
jgi:hypothetical protein